MREKQSRERETEPFQVQPTGADPRAILLPLGRLDPGENYRTEYVSEDVKGLAASMRIFREQGLGMGTGILQPFSARWELGAFRADGSLKPDAKAILNFGRSRYRAAIESGLTPESPVPVIIEDINPRVADRVAFHENIHRSDPPGEDTARKLADLKNSTGGKPLTIQQLMEETGKPKWWVQHYLDVFKLEPDTLALVNSTPGSEEIAKRINTVKEPVFREWLIEKRVLGASANLIDVFLTIRDAAKLNDGVYRNLLEWVNAQWEGARQRGEKLNPDDLLSALRSEVRAYGYALESTGKKYVWRKLQVDTLPTVNEEGEITGHTPTSPLPAPLPTSEPAEQPGEQWRQRTLTLERPSETATGPQFPVRGAIQTMTRQAIDLSHILLSVDVLPEGDATMSDLAEFEEAVQELRDRISTRLPQ